jgi:hypothetical protein
LFELFHKCGQRGVHKADASDGVEEVHSIRMVGVSCS